MKSFKTLLGAALVMAGFTACNDNNELTELIEAPQTGLQPMTFTVRAGGEEGTRSHLVNGASVMFDAGDAISVFDGEGTVHNRKFTTTAGGSVASFTGEAGTASTYYFLSPYQDDAEVIWGDKIKATVPAVQTAVADSYDPAALISVGSGTSTDPIALHNACALIKFEIASGLSDIREIKLYSTGKKIAGLANFNVDGSIDSYGETTYDHVTLRGTIAAGETYYICVLPGDLGKLTVRYITATGEVKERQAVNPLNAEPGKLYDFKVINGSDYPTMAAAWTNRMTLGQSTATSITIETEATFSGYSEDATHQKLNDGGTLWAVLDETTNTLKIQTSAEKILGPNSFLCTNSIGNQYYAGLFFGYGQVQTIDGLNKLDMSDVTDMSKMFYGCSALQSLTLPDWDTSNVTDMSYMFAFCSTLPSLTLPDWDTSNVTDMSSMFAACSALSSLTLPVWDTSNVKDMSDMFDGCSTLPSLTLPVWDTSNVTNMSYMFYDCSALQSLTFPNWDTSNVKDMMFMFAECDALENLILSSFNTSKVETFYHMFNLCIKLGSLTLGDDFVIKSGADIQAMFNECGEYVSDKGIIYGACDSFKNDLDKFYSYFNYMRFEGE